MAKIVKRSKIMWCYACETQHDHTSSSICDIYFNVYRIRETVQDFLGIKVKDPDFGVLVKFDD